MVIDEGGARTEPDAPTGPLAGLRVVEFAGLGPAPHAAMLLTDLGAEVLRIARPGAFSPPNPVLDRGRAELKLDLRLAEDVARALAILGRADVLIEGYRPGVMERLGLGPEVVCARNPRLVYGRMTGWGQTGPRARTAGHDIDYIAITGALQAMGDGVAPPAPPLNLVGDFGGGSLFLAFGIMAALYERERSGRGQVVDAAIVDGVASMMALFTGLIPSGALSLRHDRNWLAGQAPFYRAYACADGAAMAVGAIEPQFYARLISGLGLPDDLLARQFDSEAWPADRARIAEAFQTRTQAQWTDVFDGTDACVAPVLSLDQAASDPHMLARNSYVPRGGHLHPAVAPRLSRTPGHIPEAQAPEELLQRWGLISAPVRASEGPRQD